MFCAMIVSACADWVPACSCAHRHLHRGAHVGRQIGRGPDDQGRARCRRRREHPISIIKVVSHSGLAQWSAAMIRPRIERDPLGEHAVPADAYYGIQTVARRRELPHQRPARPPPTWSRATVLIKKAAAAGQRARSAGSTRRVADAIVARGRRDPRRRAARSVRRRRLPGRRRHLAQHERQRGAGQPRRGAARRRARRLPRGPPERSRQHGPVHQRRVPDGDAAGAAARRTRAAGRRAARALAASLDAEGRGVRPRPQGRPHAPAGRRADDARPGVRRLRRLHRARRRRRGAGVGAAAAS